MSRLRPVGLAAQFMALLLAVLVGANVIAAVLLAREGSGYDRMVRMTYDMHRLVSLFTALEEADRDTARGLMDLTATQYSRFSVDAAPLAEGSTLPDVVEMIAGSLPDRAVRVASANPAAALPGARPLMLISVRLELGPQAGMWLNSLIYPLPATVAWPQKGGFFAPLAVSLVATLAVGALYIRRMVRPLRALEAAAQEAGRGNHSAHVPEKGARELRQAAAAFNEMQARIAGFDRTRQTLLAAIGHDLRTPITSLRIRAEMLEDEETRDAMIRTLDGMAVMAEDLLRYARGIWLGEAVAQVDLAQLLAQVACERGAVLEPVAPLAMRLRSVAISRAIGNLVDNAQRYGGGARLRLEPAADAAVITVEDDGPGIAPERLEAVMQPFVRGEDSRSADTGGVGLGLAIARSIVIQHGGELTLSNRQPTGLRVTVRLPLRTA